MPFLCSSAANNKIKARSFGLTFGKDNIRGTDGMKIREGFWGRRQRERERERWGRI
jgi:hypothetical protein